MADGSVVISPFTQLGDDYRASVDDGSTLEYNLARNSVTSNDGYSAVNSMSVDTAQGIIKGYTQYTLDQNQPFGTDAVMGASSAFGAITLRASVIGEIKKDGVEVETADVTFEMAFDGSFIALNGTPSLGLFGDLFAGTVNTSTLASNSYRSTLTFTSSVANDASNPVSTIFDSTKSDSLSPINSEEFPGATYEILSATPDNLDAILRLTFPISVGDLLILNGSIAGTATAEVAINSFGDSLEAIASSGAVDFSNTATFKIYLPEGLSLEGDDPLINNIVVTSTVPVPGAVWLLLTGLLGLVGMSRNKSIG